jgi:hypothetical protein
MSTLRRIALVLCAVATLAAAQSPDEVRKEIEAAYAKALEATRQAKSMDDLDEIDRTFDTRDWQSISPGQDPRTWQDLRKYSFESSWAPFQSAQLIIDTFEFHGSTAVLTGRLRNVNMKGDVAFIPLKETWRLTVIGWKRQVHQKFRAGGTPR